MATGSQIKTSWPLYTPIRFVYIPADADRTEKTVWQTWFFGAASSSATEVLAANVSTTLTAAGNMTIGVVFSAAVQGLSVVTANLTKSKFFGAVVEAVSAVTGNLTIRKFFAAAVSAVSTIVGNLSGAGGAVAARAYRIYKKIQGARRWR